ncbi:MAG: hypothetical protein PHY16_10065 [Methylobacter sp.]|nr:hypothetical protein [Methylobacter sp.]
MDYYRTRMQTEEGFRDTQSTPVGLDLACESRIEAERRANLWLIAALVIFALWIVGVCLKGSAIERQIRVNSGQRYKVDSRQQSTINDGFMHEPHLGFSKRGLLKGK